MSTILLSGASGFIGTRVAALLGAAGHRIVALTRHAPRGTSVSWNAETGHVDRRALERAGPIDAVINLAGEPIDRRWTTRRRRRIRDSRVNGTDALARSLAALSPRPAVLVSGSAIGVYGAHRGDQQLDESSTAGSDFLAQTAFAWERAARPASDAGIRVVLSRTGIVLGANGGALSRMLPQFRLGLGGRFGNGKQWMSWIALEDAARAMVFLLERSDLRGPVNVVAPNPVTNRDFTDALARALDRRAFLHVPALALNVALGRMADQTVLASQRILPKRLAGAGFEFRHPRLEDALAAALSPSVRSADR